MANGMAIDFWTEWFQNTGTGRAAEGSVKSQSKSECEQLQSRLKQAENQHEEVVGELKEELAATKSELKAKSDSEAEMKRK